MAFSLSVFMVAAAATLLIWVDAAWAVRGPECAAFALGIAACWRGWSRIQAAAIALAVVSTWGFAQLAFGATLDRAGTVETSLRFAAFGAVMLAASLVDEHTSVLRVFVWFGFAIAVTGVLQSFTSGGKVFWIFPSGYPDAWGPFLSRNNFAEFLELALWFALTEDRPGYGVMAAAILAAGFASASRTGAILLAAESLAVFALLRRKPQWQFAIAAGAFVAIAGAGHLAERMLNANPFEYRREMAHSTIAMIAAHPWRGFGLGTFEAVYPAYAEFDSGSRVDHAHNDWLEWAAEGGLPFAAVWIVLAALTIPAAIRSVWGLGVPALFLHALVDYPFARFGVAAWIFLLAGLLMQRKKAE